MATQPAVSLPQPPYSSPIAGANGLLSMAWQQWFQQLFLRVGGLSAMPVASIPSSASAINLYPTGYVPTASTTIYTSPPGLRTFITTFKATNVTAVAQSLSINIVPVGGSVGSSNLALSSFSIAPQSTVEFPSIETQVLGSGAFIVAQASAPNAVQLNIQGIQTS